MDEVIKFKEQYYILANSSLADQQLRILKHGDTFAIFDRHGDIRPFGFEDHGLFHEGTRFLSRLKIRINDHSPLLLSSSVKEDNDFLIVDLTNPDLDLGEFGGFVPRGSIYIVRTFFLLEGRCYQKLSVSNYGLKSARFAVSLEFEADYVDIFEVRGMKRLKRGELREAQSEEQGVTLSYQGLDGYLRQTRLCFSEKPAQLTRSMAYFNVALKPQEKHHINCIIACVPSEATSPDLSFETAFDTNRSIHEEFFRHICAIETSSEPFNEWINQSRADLHTLSTDTDYGPYPFAGIPWFSTFFGRDGIITALQTLWLDPGIARGVLGYLAAHQAQEMNAEKDAEPGKILHEERKGEMAALKEIPFGQYYGTIDSTPLFILLAGHYYERTADKEFIAGLWPAIEKALNWINEYGDVDKDGFVEYVRKSAKGLSNQGWKDSDDSIFHSDGSLAEPSITLCEVQAYVYEAKLKAARMASMLGKKRLAVQLKKEAETLREKFIRAFWVKEIGMYALALDGAKKPCAVRSSNAGQCLFSGIAAPEHAKLMVEDFMSTRFFTGWGIRTIASTEARYNPMSYHNGSIWPHDNSLIAAGMARYGYKKEALQVMDGLFHASQFMDLRRLPELFCGFEMRPGEGPPLYPVGRGPQAWAAGSVFLMLQACLGLSIQAAENRIVFYNPVLPDFLPEVFIRNLQIGTNVVDLRLVREEFGGSINVAKKNGAIEIITIK